MSRTRKQSPLLLAGMFSHSVAGLLSTVVVLCMGLFAPAHFLQLAPLAPGVLTHHCRAGARLGGAEPRLRSSPERPGAERGWSQSSAGALLTVINAATVPVSLSLAFRGDRFGSRRFWLTMGVLFQLVGVLGVILVPAGGWAWAALIGAAIGLLFPR